MDFLQFSAPFADSTGWAHFGAKVTLERLEREPVTWKLPHTAAVRTGLDLMLI